MEPTAAMIKLTARGSIGTEAYLESRPAGRSPSRGCIRRPAARAWLCSGDMLLEALVACAGVTLKSVATAIEGAAERRRVAHRREGGATFAALGGVDKGSAGRFCRKESVCASTSIPTPQKNWICCWETHGGWLAWCTEYARTWPEGFGDDARRGVSLLHPWEVDANVSRDLIRTVSEGQGVPPPVSTIRCLRMVCAPTQEATALMGLVPRRDGMENQG